MASSSSNVVGVHYRVGKKIGEGSFGVIFEGTNLLNNQQVAIKFVRVFPKVIVVVTKVFCESDSPGWIDRLCEYVLTLSPPSRSLERAMHPNYEMNTEHIKFLLAAVRMPNPLMRAVGLMSRQLVSLMSIILAKKASTTFLSLTSSVRHSKISLITATADSLPRQLSW
jgi:hypothetical protein